MPTCRLVWVWCAAALVTAVPLAHADLMFLEPLDQTRWVRAEVRMFGEQEVDLQEADDFDRFEGSASVSFLVEDEQFINVVAGASQVSELALSPNQVLVDYQSSMGVGLVSLPTVEEPGVLFGRGESFFELVFRLDFPHFYFLPPGVEVVGITGDAQSLDARLMTDEGQVIVEGFDQQGFEGAAGRLEIGTYILRHHGAIERSSPDRLDFAGDLNFRLELVPIPLPAGVWAGLVTLAGLGLVARLRRYLA